MKRYFEICICAPPRKQKTKCRNCESTDELSISCLSLNIEGHPKVRVGKVFSRLKNVSSKFQSHVQASKIHERVEIIHRADPPHNVAVRRNAGKCRVPHLAAPRTRLNSKPTAEPFENNFKPWLEVDAAVPHSWKVGVPQSFTSFSNVKLHLKVTDASPRLPLQMLDFCSCHSFSALVLFHSPLTLFL